jgi:ATP-binding cassette subfamily B (MDR/TAP) protein 1
MAFWVISLVFWYGSGLVSRLEISTESFFIALLVRLFVQFLNVIEGNQSRQSTTFGAMHAGNVFAFVPDISSAKGAANAIIRLLDSTPAIDAESNGGEKVSGETIKGRIILEDVQFTYPTRPGFRVLRNLSITVEPGTYVALVGASGCGKSTV